MALTAKKSEANFELVPPGTHIARCYQVVDLGTQKTVWKGEEKKQHKIFLGFELPDELMSDGRPFAVGNRYTLSLSEKANLRGVLEAWRGQPFTEEEANGFDIEKLLGVPCMVNVVHNTTNGKTYANIAGIVKLPKNTKCPDPVNPPVKFSFENFSNEQFQALPEWLRKAIIQADEYSGGNSPKQTNHTSEDVPFSDDIPF